MKYSFELKNKILRSIVKVMDAKSLCRFRFNSISPEQWLCLERNGGSHSPDTWLNRSRNIQNPCSLKRKLVPFVSESLAVHSGNVMPLLAKQRAVGAEFAKNKSCAVQYEKI